MYVCMYVQACMYFCVYVYVQFSMNLWNTNERRQDVSFCNFLNLIFL